MKKDMFTFLAGLAAGVVLGLLVKDKDKERVKEAVSGRFNRMREKYEELAHEGKELVADQFNRMRGKYAEGKELVKEGLEKVKM